MKTKIIFTAVLLSLLTLVLVCSASAAGEYAVPPLTDTTPVSGSQVAMYTPINLMEIMTIQQELGYIPYYSSNNHTAIMYHDASSGFFRYVFICNPTVETIYSTMHTFKGDIAYMYVYTLSGWKLQTITTSFTCFSGNIYYMSESVGDVNPSPPAPYASDSFSTYTTLSYYKTVKDLFINGNQKDDWISEGWDEGYDVGYRTGQSDCRVENHQFIFEQGWKECQESYNESADEFYSKGWTDALNDRESVFDYVEGIATAPVVFFQTLTDFEIFGVSVAKIILVIVTAVIVGIIIKFLVKLF